jgi:hypothetical protein
MSDETLLSINGIELPVGSSRGISQTLKPIDNGDLRRTVNGDLKDLTREQNRKFESQISGQGSPILSTPAFADVWKGSELIIDCISKLRQNVNPSSSSATLIRDPVSGSISGLTFSGDYIDPDTVTGRDVTFSQDVIMIRFRPKLTMLVLAISTNEDEYEAQEGWTIDLEEV